VNAQGRERLLVDFPGDARAAFVVDDVVMGGESLSRVTDAGETCIFAGRVSLDNGGGFASFRLPIDPVDLAPFSSVKLRVRGDGQTYQLRLRHSGASDAIAYQSRFRTIPGEWQIITIPVSAFGATFRGRQIPGAPSLLSEKLVQLGFAIADRQSGSFRLEIDWVSAVPAVSGAGNAVPHGMA